MKPLRLLLAPAIAVGLVLGVAPAAFASQVTISEGPEDGARLLPGPVTFKFSTGEGGSTYQCSVDGGTPVACNGNTATYDLPPGTHVFKVEASVLGTPATPAQRYWTIRNVPCEQAGAAYRTAQGEFFLQETKLGETKTKLQKAKAKHQAGKVKKLKKKIKAIKNARDAAQAAMNAAQAQQQAVC